MPFYTIYNYSQRPESARRTPHTPSIESKKTASERRQAKRGEVSRQERKIIDIRMLKNSLRAVVDFHRAVVDFHRAIGSDASIDPRVTRIPARIKRIKNATEFKGKL